MFSLLFATFVIITTFGMGALIQSNAISSSIVANVNVETEFIAMLVVLIAAVVLFGNEKRISNVSSLLIPIAVILYLICSILLLIIYRNNLLASIIHIIIHISLLHLLMKIHIVIWLLILLITTL